MHINKVDLTDATPVSDERAALAKYELGEIVEVEDGAGIIAAVLESQFGWPGDPSEADTDEEQVKDIDEENDEIIMNASEGNPLYVVALQDGGSVVAAPDEIATDASLDREGEEIDSWERMGEDATSAELAAIYEECSSPSDMQEWNETKARLIQQQNAARLAEYVEDRGHSHEELAEYSVEELLNIPGVDDPEVGFASDPNGWDRTSYLDAWASVGGMWRTCYPRMIRHFGPNQAKRWCSALKDEILGTEEWRGDF